MVKFNVLNDGARLIWILVITSVLPTAFSRDTTIYKRPGLRERNFKGATRRLSRQNRAGNSARHRCHPRAYHNSPMRANTTLSLPKSVGRRDIEGLPFLEAIRQLILEVGAENVSTCTLHSSLHQSCAELKTNPPTSVAKAARDWLAATGLIAGRKNRWTADVRQNCRVLQCFGKALLKARCRAHCYEYPFDVARRGPTN